MNVILVVEQSYAPAAVAASLPAPAVAPVAELVLPNFDTLDRTLRATTARLTQGISPHALMAAWLDWIPILDVSRDRSWNCRSLPPCFPRG